MENRPQGREKHVTGKGKDIQKRGEGLHSGSVGRPSSAGPRPTGGSYSPPPNRPAQPRQNYSQQQRPMDFSAAQSSSGKRSPLVAIILVVVALLGGGGYGISSLLGGGSSSPDVPYSDYGGVYDNGGSYDPGYSQSPSSDLGGFGQSFDISSLLGSSVGNISGGWTGAVNTGRLNTTVDPAARGKYTRILGGGQDSVTIMVYMCGSDLESKSGMASSDLQEMANADLGNNINLIVCTGGSTSWKNSVVSSQVNQIYKVERGGLRSLVSNNGTQPMTRPSNLTDFIKYCSENYPANRNELIFWDHGGGSISGYGYDEKNPRAGSMSLAGIDEALTNAGVQFDFIGFDACLMGTIENALTLTKHADYLIASEETEPGIGWYYTDWLTKLGADSSMSTLEIGRNIVDDFVATCDKRCPGQKTTLSVVDLAELERTVPSKFSGFAQSLSSLLDKNDYSAVTTARDGSREFAVSSKADQVDLIGLSQNLDTAESRALADALRSAVKYNRTSSSITDAYGLSIYFPRQKPGQVDSAVKAYDALGLDSEYSRCFQELAALNAAAQTVSGGAASPLSSLLGGSSGGSVNTDLFSGLLSGLLSGGGSGMDFLGRGLDVEKMSSFLASHHFDPSQLVWERSGNTSVMTLSEEQWSLVRDLALNVYYDDGEGFLDLGLDNVFDFTEDGKLIGAYDGTWLAIDDQPVAYYYQDTVYDGDDYTITGRVPVLLNGSRADLIIIFDTAHPYGFIAGAMTDYRDGETQTVSKSIPELVEGDVIEYLCDYYAYDGSYIDSYRIADPVTYTGREEISNVYIDEDAASPCYLFTDIYGQSYWTPVIP